MSVLLCPHCRGTIPFPEYAGALVIRCPHCARSFKESDSVSAAGQAALRGPSPEPSALAKGTRLGVRWLIRGGALVGAGVLAWFLNGGEFWLGMGLVAVFLLGLFTFAYVKLWRDDSSAPGRPEQMALVGCGWALLLVWFVVGVVFQGGTVYIDNFSPRDLLVELDGKPWLACPAGSTRAKRLRWGGYRITVRPADGGEVLQEMTVRVKGRSVYVLNLLKAQTYEVVDVSYSVAGFSLGGERARPPVSITDGWFETTADFVFEPPPSRIRTKTRSGQDAVRRRHLRRVSAAPKN
jgi:hypothetical protein